MGYNLYITRKDEWFDEHGVEIELDEWLAVIEEDPHLKPHAEMVATDPSAAVWVNKDGGGRMWFWLDEGNIVGKNPRPDAVAKMHAISVLLDAKLIGDEGEHYDASGNASHPDFPAPEANKAGTNARPWWKFW
ncbi:hypothetical protein N9741_03310 [Octadecabacter sp.]|nr:hypothetical protein [Octadecabacter sp.]